MMSWALKNGNLRFKEGKQPSTVWIKVKIVVEINTHDSYKKNGTRRWYQIDLFKKKVST